MSQTLAPRPVPPGGISSTIKKDDGDPSSPASSAQRPRKISTACGACKQRKTRCTGGTPCEACASRNSPCTYDASSDQRRKIANQRNVANLAEAQHDLDRCRQLLGGIFAIIRAGDFSSNNDLTSLIRSGVDLSQVAAHVRNEARSNFSIQQAYDAINFVIDGSEELPSPTQILNRIRTVNSARSYTSDGSDEANHTTNESRSR